MNREDIAFNVEGLQCAAWLYRPDGPGPHPGIILGHGFTGIRHVALDDYGRRFTQAGYVTLVFDYRHFGDSEGQPRQLLDIKKQHQDWRGAIDAMKNLPDVDPDRIALWGTSFSGGHVLVMAAEDSRIKAIISQVPFVDGLTSLKSTSLFQGVRLLKAGLQDVFHYLVGRPSFYIDAAGPPGSLAALTTPDAEPGYRSIVPPDIEINLDVAARILLTLPFYRPISVVEKIRCPVLFCLGEHDQITPIAPALKAAARTKNAKIIRYSLGHFDIYKGEAFEKAIGDQLNFLNLYLKK